MAISVGCHPSEFRSATFQAQGDVSVKTVSDGGKKSSIKAGMANIVPYYLHCKAAVFNQTRYAVQVGPPARCAIGTRCHHREQDQPDREPDQQLDQRKPPVRPGAAAGVLVESDSLRPGSQRADAQQRRHQSALVFVAELVATTS